MAKWSDQTIITGESTSVDDLLLLSDQSQTVGTRDRNIDLAELSVAVGRFRVAQTSHGLSVGDCVRFNGTNYVEATADTIANAQAIGLVVEVVDANVFVMQQSGRAFGLSGLVAGSRYYLQDAGGLGTSPGTVHVSVLVAASTTTGWLIWGTQDTPEYEEGTWTPLITDGTNNATMTTQDGSYTRIGDICFVFANVVVNSPGSVATARLAGLPFVGAGTVAGGVTATRGDSLAISAGYNITGTISSGNSYAALQRWDTTNGTTGLNGAEISASGALWFVRQYNV